MDRSNSRNSSSQNLDNSNIALVQRKLNKIDVAEKSEECSLDDFENLKHLDNIMPDKDGGRPFTAQGRSPKNQSKRKCFKPFHSK